MSKNNEGKVAVSRIEIKIGSKTISLTLEEFGHLKDAIDDLFPERIVYQPSSPIYIERDRWPCRPAPYWGVSYKADMNASNSGTLRLASNGK